MQNEIISNLKNQLISTLLSKQKPNGEFELFASTGDRKKFYIGESPFLTAHIIYHLHEIDDLRVHTIVGKALDFLEKIDYTDKRIYKFWYNNAIGTAFPFLPFDLDDTALVNQVLSLYKRKTVNRHVLLNNRSNDKLFYTWLKPSFKTLIQSPDYFFLFAEYLKSYRVFLKNANKLKMAEFDDSEIIVRMNVYIMMAINGYTTEIAEKEIPFNNEDIKKELSSSLHYDNAAMYYLTLAKFQKHSCFFNTTKCDQLAEEIRKQITSVDLRVNREIANSFSLYLSLSLINKLTPNDGVDIIKILKSTNLEDALFEVCVGNKKFDSYHTYTSVDFTLSCAIRLLNDFQILSSNVKI